MSETTRTLPTPEAPDDDASELGALLERVALGETENGWLAERLASTGPAELRENGQTLLDLLDDERLGRRGTDTPVRRALIRAVLEAGYPWALQLAPEELPLAHQAAPSRWKGAARRWLTVALVFVLGVAGGLATYQRLRPQGFPNVDHSVVDEAPDTAVTPEQLGADDIAPDRTREALLTEMIQRSFAAGRWDDGVTIATDCLGDPKLDGISCLHALRPALLQRGNAEQNVDLVALAHSIPDERASWENMAEFRRTARPVLIALQKDLTPLQPPRDRGRQLADEELALRALTERHLTNAWRLAENCLAAHPNSLTCSTVAFRVHQIASERTEGLERESHQERVEFFRRRVARLRSHAARVACEANPSTAPLRPPACP